MKKILVKVTKKDIERGVLQDVRSCPIARACHKLGWRGIEIGENEISFDNERESISLPQIARRFIERFDASFGERKKIKPIQFWINRSW